MVQGGASTPIGGGTGNLRDQVARAQLDPLLRGDPELLRLLRSDGVRQHGAELGRHFEELTRALLHPFRPYLAVGPPPATASEALYQKPQLKPFNLHEFAEELQARLPDQTLVSLVGLPLMLCVPVLGSDPRFTPAGRCIHRPARARRSQSP